MNLPVEVLDAVRKGRCTLFVGRRASMEAAELAGRKVLSEKKLARRLAGARVSLQEALAQVEAREGRQALVNRLQQEFGFQDVQPTSFHVTAIKRFPLILTSCWDDLLERAALSLGAPADVAYRGEDLPQPDLRRRVVYKFWGGFERPDTLALTAEDRRRLGPPAGWRKQWRLLLRSNVLWFVGYRPDEQEFDDVWEEVSEAYGGELPRCHLAVAQGRIDDYHWQKWVWRGLLMFTADPVEAMEALEKALRA